MQNFEPSFIVHPKLLAKFQAKLASKLTFLLKAFLGLISLKTLHSLVRICHQCDGWGKDGGDEDDIDDDGDDGDEESSGDDSDEDAGVGAVSDRPRAKL